MRKHLPYVAASVAVVVAFLVGMQLGSSQAPECPPCPACPDSSPAADPNLAPTIPNPTSDGGE